MGTRERRVRERAETRELILDAARRMFAEAGYEAVTMRAIADTIEYTPTAIYHHFQNKQALVTELCHIDFRSLAAHFVSAVRIGDPVERIRAIGDAYLEFAEQNPNHYRFMFMTALPEIEHPPEFIAETKGHPERDAYEFLRRTVQEAVTAGAFRPEYGDPDLVAQILWSALHGIIALQIVHRRKEDWVEFKGLRETARAATDALLRGMLNDVSATAAGAKLADTATP